MTSEEIFQNLEESRDWTLVTAEEYQPEFGSEIEALAAMSNIMAMGDYQHAVVVPNGDEGYCLFLYLECFGPVDSELLGQCIANGLPVCSVNTVQLKDATRRWNWTKEDVDKYHDSL